METGLERIAAKARSEPKLRFTSLAHHITQERVWKNLCQIPKRSAPGVDGQTVDDGLGYDFELMNGSTKWLFEVKSTTAAGPATLQSIELGSTEFLCAEAWKTDRRIRYRILYITDALHPENAQIFPLPNPRSREGVAFFTDQHAGHRLYFPLKP